MPPEKVIALVLLGPKSMDQEQWVETTINDIFKSVKKKAFLEPQPPQRSAKLPHKEVSSLSLEVFKNKH